MVNRDRLDLFRRMWCRLSRVVSPRLLFWISVGLLAGLFEWLVRSRTISPASYAAPSEIMKGAVLLFWQKAFLHDVIQTTARSLLGFIIGFPAGVVAAFAIYFLGRARPSGEKLLDFVRSIPITALVPLFIAVYGVGERNKVAIGAVSAFLVTAITVWVGVKQSLARQSILLHLYAPTRLKRMALVVLPQSLPTVAAAMRLAISASLVLVVVAEMFVGSRTGIGKVINDLSYGDNRPGQYAAILCAGCLGYLLNQVFEVLRVEILTRAGLENGASLTGTGR